MKTKTVIAILVILSAATMSFGQSTAFTYQGSLQDAAVPANGNYDLEFRLYDSLTGGTEVNTFIQSQNVPVVNGQFTISLNFGPVFTGAPRYLEVRVRTAGGTTFTTLNPRTVISTTPYAVRSLSASNAETLNGIASTQFVLTNDVRMTDARNPLPNSSNYIQNTSGVTPQANSNFNISGTGRAGNFVASGVQASIVSADSEYRLLGNRLIRFPLTSSSLTVGVSAGADTMSGRDNNLFGYLAGSQVTTGERNSIFGTEAGRSISTSSMNSIFGYQAGYNQTGNFNSIFGSWTLFTIGAKTGDYNSFFGHRAGQISNGNFNSFYGTGAGFNNDTGSSNTFIGRNSGDANTTGSFNVALGEFANLGIGTLTNASAIGSKAFVTQSNSMILGSINGVNGATADTNIGIGTTAPTARLSVFGGGFGNNLLVSDSNTTATTFDLANTSPGGRSWRFQSIGSADATRVGNLELWNVGGPPVLSVTPGGAMTINRRLNYFDTVGNANFFMKAAGAANGINFGVAANSGSNSTLYISQYDGTTYQDRFIIDNNGEAQFPGSSVFVANRLRIGTTTPYPSARLEIGGWVTLGLDGNGTTAVCRNANSALAFCSSSIRYKQNVRDYSPGLDLVLRLRPVSFNWKSNNLADFGLIAEEVNAIEPLLTTTNDKGEVEGVKYDRVGVVALNAIREQQEQIVIQQKEIDRLKAELEALKRLVCAISPAAELCKQ